MDVSKVLGLVTAGESEHVEFKRELDRAERLAREIVALANRQGGTVVVGIEDAGSICGVTLRPGYEEWIANVGAETIDPPLPLAFETMDVKGKTVLLIQVPRGSHKPHCVREGEHRCTVYVRHGTTSRPATREEIGSLYQEAGSLDYDLSPIPGATLDDLSALRRVPRSGSRWLI